MIKKLIPVAVATLAIYAVVLPNATASGSTGGSAANVRDATAAFNDPSAALAAGYELLTDAADIACIDQPGAGAMGIHYVKGSLVQAGTVDAARPQALVYQRTADGRLQLGAVEYVVLQAGWDTAHAAPPALFGENFMLTSAENRYGLPAFYSLHAWVWKDNPLGTFSMWNPSVSCSPNDGAPAFVPVMPPVQPPLLPGHPY
jgi:hypothetical protein